MYSDPRHILIVHIASLSETILALPALRSLRIQLPNTHLTVAASSAGADLIRLAQCANELLPVGRLRRAEVLGTRALYRSLSSLRNASQQRFDLAIEFQKNAEAAVLMNFAKPARRLNATNKGFAKVIETLTGALNKFGQTKHQAQRYLELVEPLGVRPSETAPRLFTDREADERIEKLLHKKGWQPGELLIGLHPGAGKAVNRWAAPHFAALGERFIHNFNARTVVFSGPRERHLSRSIIAALPKEKVIALESPKTTDFVSALARLSLFVANHSGPAHIAAAVGAPVVVASVTTGNSPRDILNPNCRHIRAAHAEMITEEDFYNAACVMLQSSRADILAAI